MKSLLYYECHITIEPVFDTQLEMVKTIALVHGFKVADLLMQKRREDKPEQSKFDTFLTTRGKDYDGIVARMVSTINHLKGRGFKVWRYKIEDTICDSKINDIYDGIGEGKITCFMQK